MMVSCDLQSAAPWGGRLIIRAIVFLIHMIIILFVGLLQITYSIKLFSSFVFQFYLLPTPYLPNQPCNYTSLVK